MATTAAVVPLHTGGTARPSGWFAHTWTPAV